MKLNTIFATLLLTTATMFAAKETDLTKGLDLTGRTNVTGSQLNQLVDAGILKEGKGGVIAGMTSPDVYNNKRYTNWLWLDTAMYPPILKQWISGPNTATTNANSYTNWAFVGLPQTGLLNTNQFYNTQTNISIITTNLYGQFNTNVNEIWIAARTDGYAGSGLQHDPYDGSSATKFDNIMSNTPPNTTIHLGQGTFYTVGLNADPTVPHWQIKDGWQIKGSGMYNTKIRVTTVPSLGTVGYSVIGNIYTNGCTNVYIGELTLDANATDNVNGPAGALALYGGNIMVDKVRCIGFAASTLSSSECFVMYLAQSLRGNYTNTIVSAWTNYSQIVQDCIFEEPKITAATAQGITMIDVGSPSHTNSFAGQMRNVIVRNNKVDARGIVDMVRGITAYGKTAVIQNNVVIGPGVNVKGFYFDTGTLGNTFINGNTFSEVQCGVQLEQSSFYNSNSPSIVVSDNFITLTTNVAGTSQGIRIIMKQATPIENLGIMNNYITMFSPNVTSAVPVSVDGIVVDGVKRLNIHNNVIPTYDSITGGGLTSILIGNINKLNINNNYRVDGSYAAISSTGTNVFSGMPPGFAYNPDTLINNSYGMLYQNTNWNIFKSVAAFAGTFILHVIDTTNYVTSADRHPQSSIIFQAHVYPANDMLNKSIKIISRDSYATNLIGNIGLWGNYPYYGIFVSNIVTNVSYNLSYMIANAEQQITPPITTNNVISTGEIRVNADNTNTYTIGNPDLQILRYGTNMILIGTNYTPVTNAIYGVTNISYQPSMVGIDTNKSPASGSMFLDPLQSKLWLFAQTNWNEVYTTKSFPFIIYGSTNLPTFVAAPGVFYMNTNDGTLYTSYVSPSTSNILWKAQH